jgi:hypothetical protein
VGHGSGVGKDDSANGELDGASATSGFAAGRDQKCGCVGKGEATWERMLQRGCAHDWSRIAWKGMERDWRMDGLARASARLGAPCGGGASGCPSLSVYNEFIPQTF